MKTESLITNHSANSRSLSLFSFRCEWEFALCLSPYWSLPTSSLCRVLAFSFFFPISVIWGDVGPPPGKHDKAASLRIVVKMYVLLVIYKCGGVGGADSFESERVSEKHQKVRNWPLWVKRSVVKPRFHPWNGFLLLRIQSSFCAETSHRVVRHQLSSAAMPESLTSTQGAMRELPPGPPQAIESHFYD